MTLGMRKRRREKRTNERNGKERKNKNMNFTNIEERHTNVKKERQNYERKTV